jgi:hypothetical protein
MDSQLIDKVKKLNKISLIFGILSVAMPILFICLPFLFRIIQVEEIYFSFLTQAINFMQLSGIIFGMIGYFISRQVLNLIKYEKANDELISKTQASRSWNMIGIVIFLTILCGSLNRGFAF